MPKRPVTVQSDPESDEEYGSPKRARTDDFSDAEEVQAGPSQRRTQTQGRSGGRARGRGRTAQNEESDVEDDEADIPVAVDDEEFEKAHEDDVRAQIESKKNVKRDIAEYGIIERIEMTDFMCHKSLKFEFGPQINFIIGHNGSGKSAVLSALTVALGGKTNSTGRGSGLKSFIREGQHKATVTVQIKNQGVEAFKPEEYGDSIIIFRSFTKDGSSSWKILAADGKTTISNKREELSAICDHMNIQVDNPLNVLTQDSARQFLSASHPQDKYKFFLLGTQLAQLSNEYDTCLDNIRKTAKILATKKEAIPDLKTKYNRELARYKEAEKAREQKKKIDDLKRELAWSHVKEKEDQLEKDMKELAKLQNRLPKIQQNLEKAQSDLAQQEAVVAACEQETENLGSIDHLSERRQKLANETRTNKGKVMNYMTDVKAMNASIAALKRQVEELQTNIEVEQRRMEADSQAKRELLERQIGEVKTKLTDLEARQQEATRVRVEAQRAAERLREEGQNAEKGVTALQNRIVEAQDMAKRARASMRDIFIPYGQNIKAVLEDIQKCQWIGDKPLGPLGLYVKAKEPEKWGEILRGQLLNHLTAFAITNPKDREQLKNILGKYRNQNSIIIFEKDLFDFSSGEPPAQFHTVLRALEISDPYVLRILINQSQIERIVLSDRRKQLENDLQQLRGGFGWSLDKFNVKVYPDGGVYSSGLPNRKMNDGAALLLTGRDSQAEITHYEQRGVELSNELVQLNQKVGDMKQQYTQARREIDRLTAQERTIRDQHNQLKMNLGALQDEANEELPTGVTGYQNAKDDAEAEIANTEKQMAAAAIEMKKLQEVQAALLTQLGEVKAELQAFGAKKDELQNRLTAAVADRVQKQSDVGHWEKKLTAEEAGIQKQKESVAVTQKEFETWTEGALKFCERVENARRVDIVNREHEAAQKALREREKQQGASVEDLAAAVNKAREAYDKVEREWKHMSNLNKGLRASLHVRLHRWQEFRRHIALRCRIIFGFHLSRRGYFGKVLFNHAGQTLTLRVQTDDQIQDKGAAEKDPKSLSGGEKSFSTICLLLSLWDSIGCPLRCLDEFDVFMDAVNRRISMRMMIEVASANQNKQYILITPQDMTNIHIGDNVKVLRMLDPERGNARLNFPVVSSR
ncbi:hypothetical protein H1R20_g4748, partial [Candolleomyces eurysporus]